MKKKRPPIVAALRKRNRPIALLTDFGSADHYVGTMKGVILTVNPKATIIDISHEVAPFDVREAGYLLWASYRHFPPGTVFTCVVDPGVGGSRRIICVQAGTKVFVAADNGLLDFVVFQEAIRQACEVDQSGGAFAGEISATFHGRDIFAPLSAQLSVGKPIRAYGKTVPLSRPVSPFYEPDSGVMATHLLHIDRFGNLVTNIPRIHFEGCDLGVGPVKVSRHIGSFSEAPDGEACLIVGSSGLVEVVAKETSAARLLGAGLHTPLTVLKPARNQ